MNIVFENTVKQIIDMYGVDALLNAKFFIAVFSDLAPQLKKEKKILSIALNEGVGQFFVNVSESEQQGNITRAHRCLDGILAPDAVDLILDCFCGVFNFKTMNEITPNIPKAISPPKKTILSIPPSFTPTSPKKKLTMEEIRSLSFDQIEKEASNGSASAMLFLAEHYHKTNDSYKSWVYFQKAMQHYQNMAGQGDAEAMRMLGYCYEHDVQKDYGKAVICYERAAQMGDVSALVLLSHCFEYGHGVNRNQGRAIELLSKAAIAGHAGACEQLGNIYIQSSDYDKALEYYKKALDRYENNQIGDKIYTWLKIADCYYIRSYQTKEQLGNDYILAFEWYEKAANAGNREAQWKLGDCYYYGNGIKRDYTIAFEWYSRSAKAGNKDAMLPLSDCYLNGIGVKKDKKQALYWLNKCGYMEETSYEFDPYGESLIMKKRKSHLKRNKKRKK